MRVSIVGKNHAGIKRAGFPVLETPDMRDGVFGRCGIFPSDGCTRGHGGGFGDEVW